MEYATIGYICSLPSLFTMQIEGGFWIIVCLSQIVDVFSGYSDEYVKAN